MTQRTFAVGLPEGLRSVQTDIHGKTMVGYTITNLRETDVRGLVQAVAKSGANMAWVTLIGPEQRDFSGRQSVAYELKIVFPVGTKPGTYNFRIDAADAADPSGNFTSGPLIAVEHNVNSI